MTIEAPKPKKAAPKAIKAAAKPARPTRTASRHVPNRTTRRSDDSAPTGAPVAASSASGEAIGGAGQGTPSPAVAAAITGEAVAQAQRAFLLPKVGANSTTITRENIEQLPAGDNTPFDRALLQLPGVTLDTAGSGDFHIRNEHANVQYRINGIFLPEGVSGFSQVLSSTLVGSISLLDGALPAQYGLRTSGVLDITTRNGTAPQSSVDVFGGSRETLIPTFTTSGVSGRWDYFFTGRYITDNIGIENPIPTHDAIHDRTRQGRYFAYASGLLEDGSRLTFMSGADIAKYQIPNTPGLTPQFVAFGVTDYPSLNVNENQLEHAIFNVLAWQKSFGVLDSQVSYFQRYSTLHYIPDTIGDLVYNGVASDVFRSSLINGIQADNAYRVNDRDTLRFGFLGDIERAEALDSNVVLPLDPDGNPIDAPFTLPTAVRKTGYTAGGYVQNEYRVTPQLAVNGGLRYDYVAQYVTADQLSPRIGMTYTPVPGTVIHAGYARYFTPPQLSLAAPFPAAEYNNTTAAADVTESSPVRPERSHVFDVGITRQVLPGLELGLDGYYKLAKNLIDDGQFGQALVLTAFNYDHGYNEGVEFKANYVNGGFRAYGNLAYATQMAKQVSSNQYLFSADEIAYIAQNYIYTDHAQFITVSGGGSYRFGPNTVSTDIIYGSGLRDGFANTGTVSPYAVVNVGATHDFVLIPGKAPATLRFTVVNLLDHPYVIRDGSGIGVFAAQYGQRRGFFAGLTTRF